MEIYLIIISLVFSAFFSGIEIAFVSSNKLKVELSKQQGILSGKILAKFMERPSHFIGATLIGNNISLILLGIMMTKFLSPYIDVWLAAYSSAFSIMIIQTIITTIIVLVVGEFLPKALFRINPDLILRIFSVPLLFLYYLLYPLVRIVTGISVFTLRFFLRVRYEESKPVYTRIDLEDFVNRFVRSDSDDEEVNTNFFEKALYLTKIKVRECLVPRTEICALPMDAGIEELRQEFIESKHSKILIYENTIDQIKGYVHHFDLLKKPENINDILFPIKVVPESMPARELLNYFIKEQKSIAWVVDEFGGTSGIVTLEDVLEEIFGEIKDEHDSEDFIEKQLSENEYIFSGRIEVDYLNEKYELNIPEGEYETLAGYIYETHESIPEMGEVLKMDHFEIGIINVSDTRIETVKLSVLEGEL
ncbi:MAG: hemolysin family protein [Chitinophagales bacterium]